MDRLKTKILYTILMLIAYRLGSYIPVPGIDVSKLANIVKLTEHGVLGMFNVFSGGSIARMSIFALSIMPYITSSIVMQLIISSNPNLKKLKTEGDAGQRKIHQWTKYLAVFIAFFQGFALANGLESMGLFLDIDSLFYYKIITAITLTTGTILLMWIGERISKSGIGNGISLIIFTGIVSSAPRDIVSMLSLSRNGVISFFSLFFLLAVFVGTVLFVVWVEKSNRLIPIQYPRQSYQFISQKDSGPKMNHLPFKINTAGVVPPIFANSLLLLPLTFTSFGASSPLSQWIALNLNHGKLLFMVLYIVLVVFFTFFYNNLVFDTNDIANNLKKSNAFVPGVRPGASTAAFLHSILTKLSCFGAIYLVIVCVLPELLSPVYGYSFFIGGTGILIVVNVVIDTMIQIQTHLLSGRYEKAFRKYNMR